MKLVCKTCGTAISKNVAFIDNIELIEQDRVQRANRKTPCDPGYATRYAPTYQVLRRGKYVEITADSKYLLNLSDLVETVKYHPDPGRLNGCCGLDGCDGFNRICKCGAPVGTETSDCWTKHEFVPNMEALVWSNS